MKSLRQVNVLVRPQVFRFAFRTSENALGFSTAVKNHPVTSTKDSQMTDSIKITLRLTKMAALVRKDIDAHVCNLTNLWGEFKGRYTKPSHQKSSMAETKTKWIVRCEKDPKHPEDGDVPVRIDGDLNIPNSMVGHNLEHGTSVFAAGRAALEHLRIWMAQSGLPRAELDLLTVADVELRGVTITYLIRCATQAEAIKLVEAIRVTGKVLNKDCKAEDSTNITVVLPYSTFTVKTYIKTNLKHCKFEYGCPQDELVEDALHIVRIEVMVGERFLKKLKVTGPNNVHLDMLKLESWRDAYALGVYQMIFDMTIRKRLSLGQLRHKAPREEVFTGLTPTESQLLRDYLDGGDPRQFRSVVESVTPAKRFSALRMGILRTAKVDIDIPWVEHVKLRSFELDPLLHYPGDHEPSEAHAPWCFCKSNWPNLRREFNNQYEAALAAAVQKQALLDTPTASSGITAH
jgi:hypothetical protein